MGTTTRRVRSWAAGSATRHDPLTPSRGQKERTETGFPSKNRTSPLGKGVYRRDTVRGNSRDGGGGGVISLQLPPPPCFSLFPITSPALFLAVVRARRVRWGGAARNGRVAGHPDRRVPPPPPPRTKWTRRVPHPVLIGHAVRKNLSRRVAYRSADALQARRARRRGACLLHRPHAPPPATSASAAAIVIASAMIITIVVMKMVTIILHDHWS